MATENIEPEGFDPSATFEKMKVLLKAKDDTSRFVGLALLKTVLDNGQLLKDPERIRSLWEAISPKFLDRLLRSQQNEKISRSDAKDMVDLAVAVLHTFSTLLPEDSQKEKRLTGRAAPLVRALIQSPPETTSLILQTLLTIVSRPEGALEVLAIEDASPLIEIAAQYPYVLDIFRFTWINASTDKLHLQTVRTNIDDVLPTLILVFKGTDAVTLIGFAGDLLARLDSQCLSQSPKWLGPLVLLVRKLVSKKPTAKGRVVYTQLAAALLQVYPSQCPTFLFRNDTSTTPENKPFSYLFINLLLIDLRSTFPSLLARLNTADYPSTSQRLAAAFDVLSSFTGFLLRDLDDETSSLDLIMPPDLLLKLRKDIAETISLTIEYLRDRWDASIAGASGLHNTARSGTSSTSEGTHLTLTWDSISSKDDVKNDPLILAGIRAIAIWIREDDNDNLRSETAGLMDMFIELYQESSHGSASVDFRYPVLLALEGIMATEAGIEPFLAQNGWQIVSDDLESILRSTLGGQENSAVPAANRGLQIVRVLLAVLDHPHTTFPEESWMATIKATAGMKTASLTGPSVVLEFQIAMLQLSTALFGKASGGMTKRHITSHPALVGIAKQLKSAVGRMDDKIEAAELMGLLDDVSLDLDNIV